MEIDENTQSIPNNNSEIKMDIEANNNNLKIINEYNNKVKEILSGKNNIILKDDIILKASNDKNKTSKKEPQASEEKDSNIKEFEKDISEPKVKNVEEFHVNKNYRRQNGKIYDKIRKKDIEEQLDEPNLIEEKDTQKDKIINMIHDDIILKNSNFKSQKDLQNEHNDMNTNIYSNPLISQAKDEQLNIIKEQDNKEEILPENKSQNFNIPNITLTAFPKNDNSKGGKFSGFLNLFSSKKKIEQNENRTKPIDNDKIDIVLKSIPTQKDESKEKDIQKLKNDLNGRGHYIPGSEIKNKDIDELNECNNNQDNININDDGAQSTEIFDFDNNSEYTLQTGTGIDRLVKKKTKLPAYLIPLIIGTGGVIILCKISSVKEILLNFVHKLKTIPNGIKKLLTILNGGFHDFMIHYSDDYRLLSLLIMIIVGWFIIKILTRNGLKFLKKRKEKKVVEKN